MLDDLKPKPSKGGIPLENIVATFIIIAVLGVFFAIIFSWIG